MYKSLHFSYVKRPTEGINDFWHFVCLEACCPAEQSPRDNWEAGNIGDLYMRFWLSTAMEVQHFSNSFINKNERITFNGANFKMKVDLKEKITKRYLRSLSGDLTLFDMGFL